MKTCASLLILCLFIGINTQESQFECGKTQYKIRVGYNFTDYSFPGRWPWQGIVYHRKPDRALEYACGCTLISDRHVITSGLCVKTENGSLVDSEVLFVRLGTYEHNLLHFGSAQHRKVRKIHLPNGDYENKIVILEFRKNVKFSIHIQPICVSEDYNVEYMLGWSASDGKRKLQKITGAEEECSFGEFVTYYDHTEICEKDRGSIGLGHTARYNDEVWHLFTVIDCTTDFFDPCSELSVDNKVNQITIKGYIPWKVNQITIKGYIPWIGAITKLKYLLKTRQGQNFDPSQNYPQLLPHSNCGHIFVEHNDHDLNAQLYEYPWIARVVYRKGFTYSNDQLGALISYRYVLTAAENVFSPNNERISYVKLGEYHLRQDPDCISDDEDDCAPPARYYDVEYVVIHQNYNTFNKESTMYNIALIRTTEVIAYEDHIHPVCLPVTEELRQLKLSEFVFAGWNMLDEDETMPTSILQHAKFSECYRNQTQNAASQTDVLICPFAEFIWSDMIVGAPVGNIIDYNNGMRFVQFTINLSIHNAMGIVQTNLAYFMNWIIANMEE